MRRFVSNNPTVLTEAKKEGRPFGRPGSPVKYGEREATASGLVIRDGHTLMKRMLEYG